MRRNTLLGLEKKDTKILLKQEKLGLLDQSDQSSDNSMEDGESLII